MAGSNESDKQVVVMTMAQFVLTMRDVDVLMESLFEGDDAKAYKRRCFGYSLLPIPDETYERYMRQVRSLR